MKLVEPKNLTEELIYKFTNVRVYTDFTPEERKRAQENTRIMRRLGILGGIILPLLSLTAYLTVKAEQILPYELYSAYSPLRTHFSTPSVFHGLPEQLQRRSHPRATRPADHKHKSKLKHQPLYNGDLG